MSLLTKTQIAVILNIPDADISASIYTLAKSQFFILTKLQEAEVIKTFNKFIGSSTTWLSLPDKNIKSIDSLTIGTTVAEVSATTVAFNPDSGLMSYTGGFSGGQLVTVGYTVNAYTVADIHNYLLILLVLKQVALFSPSKVDNVSSFKIGRFSKSFGAATKSQTDLVENLDNAIVQAVDLINGDDGRLEVGAII